jgi:hypothetical protein
MARRAQGADLGPMYTNLLHIGRVRDGTAAYRTDGAGPEPFPGERVLHDLARAPAEDASRIVARYAALRAWILHDRGGPLATHARESAVAHLAAAPADWPEGEPLGRLARDPHGDPESFIAIAELAESAGHREGAAAVLHAGYRSARHRAELRTAGRLAVALGELLERRGDSGAAWVRRGQRLLRLAETTPPDP